MAKSNPNIPTVDIEEVDIETGYVTLGTVEGTPPAGATYAGIFALEAILQDIDGGGTYTNTGTVAVPAWTLFGTVAALAQNNIFVGTAGGAAAAVPMSGDATIVSSGALTIGANKITLAKLAAGITPSHVIKYAGTASGGTTATRAYTITGVASTDVATCVIRASTNAASIQKATLTTDTLTILFSTDPGAATTVDYQIARAAV